MDIAAADLDRIRDLYDRGLYLQAYAIARPYGRFHDWKGTAARIMAGRLAGNLGARRLACALHITTWRADRDHPEALYYHAYALLDRRGPLAAWEALRARGDFKDAPLKHRADLFALVAEVAASLRDFDTADHWIARSEEITPDRVWTEVERSRIFELEDRYEEALAAARRSMELHPWYRPAVQAAAHLLQLLDRDPEALQLLREAGKRLESGSVMAQLAALETELGLHAEARESVERFGALSPLLEKDGARWLAARRSDLAYSCGDLARAAEHAPAADTPFYKRLSENLPKADPGRKRVLLPVGFVRQHHMTCAPATLSAISRFWSMPAEHLAVAERICYDGTPAHSERRWAEENGWAAREFTVTWECAVRLLDRGVPFTFTTVEPGNAHLQSVIGYDSFRRTLIVRDPYERNWGEFLDPEMFERYRSCGPRGMLLVPRERASLVDGIALPDAELYDDLYRLLGALERHDRDEASRAQESLAARAPGHRLTLWGRRSLASYDADRVTQLACVEELLKLHPDDANLRLSKFHHLREMGRREERLQLLREQCDKEGAHPIFWQAYARELSADARRSDEAERLCTQAIRYNPRDAESIHILAGLHWNRRDRERALALYRFAACLEDKNEAYAESYFVASRHLRQTAQAVLFLRNRFRRFGKRSAWPARTLFWAFEQLDRSREAFEVLEEALKLRPDDGDLLLFAADAHARTGTLDRAAELLRVAEGKSHRGAWLRTSAHLAADRGATRAALELWRSIAEVEPLAMDAHSNVARLLAETEGRAATFDALQRAAERFPHHAGIHQLWIEWLRDGEPEEHEAAIRRLIAINPDDAWARRELALFLTRRRRLAEAFEQADAAYRLDPAEPSTFTVRAAVCTAAGKTAAAQEACRESIRLSVDWDPALKDLVYSTNTLGERREALAFIRQELIRQVIFGDGLITYRELSKDTIEPEELLGHLKEAAEARPDLWHAWAAVVRQTAEMNRLDESLDLARKATDRFPLVARLWVELAFVCRLKGDAAGERAALEQALRISPSWSFASRELASLHERAGDFAGARAVLEQAVARSPLDPYNHSHLADMLWKLGEREAAISRVEKLVQLEPSYESAWGTLLEWSGELKRPETPRKLARELAERRSGDGQSWIVLARILDRPEDLEERLRALARAVELDPRSTEGPDMRARLLAEFGRFDEALAACGGVDAPLMLRGRAAWVEARRRNRKKAIERMRSLVSEDPSYYWGWLQLADWTRDENLNREYLESAKAILRLTPQRGLAFGYVGDAKLRLGDRAGAKADFARAMELAPDYGFAGFSLFDLQLEDGELDRAEATLKTLRVQVGGVFTLAREVQLAVKRKDQGAAREAVRRLSESTDQDAWPFEAALAALAEAGWEGEVEEGPPRWAGAWLARAREKARPVEARLRAIEVAGRLDPSNEDAADLKAVVLAEAGRFDEALAVCGGAGAPVALRGRAAWVEAERGDRARAIRLMKKVVEEDRAYRWGWSRLADWQREEKDDAGYLEAARELVVLAPDEGISHGYLGEALVRRGDRDRARASFARALELSPGYEFSGFWLFDLRLEDGELDPAAETLAHLQAHVGGPFTLGRAAQLAARRKDEAGASGILLGLCGSGETEAWPFETAMKAMKEAGWGAAAERLLRREIAKAGINPLAAEAWMKACAGRGAWKEGREGLEALRASPAAWSRAAGEYMERLAEKRRTSDLRAFLKEERDLIVGDDRAWGCAGYALNEAGLEAEAVEWLSGWRSRKEVKPWMLLNLAVSQRAIGRAEEARATSIAALGLPTDHATADHRLWVAFEEAFEEGPGAAPSVDVEALKPFYRCLRLLTLAVLEGRKGGFDGAVARLREAAAAMPKYAKDPLLRAAYRRSVDRIARVRGGVGGAMWGWFRRTFTV